MTILTRLHDGDLFDFAPGHGGPRGCICIGLLLVQKEDGGEGKAFSLADDGGSHVAADQAVALQHADIDQERIGHGDAYDVTRREVDVDAGVLADAYAEKRVPLCSKVATSRPNLWR